MYIKRPGMIRTVSFCSGKLYIPMDLLLYGTTATDQNPKWLYKTKIQKESFIYPQWY